jgi:uncharacterized protein YbjT (DUF2867 family)
LRFNHKDFKHAFAVENTLKLFAAARTAGMRRIVHVSITNPASESPLEYFRGKAQLEQALIDSGISYAILRPAVLFEEIEGLMQDLLYTRSAPAGKTRLTDWAQAHADSLGKHYAGELARRRDRTTAYKNI